MKRKVKSKKNEIYNLSKKEEIKGKRNRLKNKQKNQNANFWLKESMEEESLDTQSSTH